MTIDIININDTTINPVSHGYGDDDAISDIAETTYEIQNTDYPTDCDDPHLLVIEYVKYRYKPTDGIEEGWSWNIIYNAYGDNHILADECPPKDKGCYCDSGYETLEACSNDAYEALLYFIEDVKNLIAKIDEEYHHDMG